MHSSFLLLNHLCTLLSFRPLDKVHNNRMAPCPVLLKDEAHGSWHNDFEDVRIAPAPAGQLFSLRRMTDYNQLAIRVSGYCLKTSSRDYQRFDTVRTACMHACVEEVAQLPCNSGTFHAATQALQALLQQQTQAVYLSLHHNHVMFRRHSVVTGIR